MSKKSRSEQLKSLIMSESDVLGCDYAGIPDQALVEIGYTKTAAEYINIEETLEAIDFGRGGFNKNVGTGFSYKLHLVMMHYESPPDDTKYKHDAFMANQAYIDKV